MHNPVFAFWDLSLHFNSSCIIFWIESSAAEASRELNVKLFERILFPLPGSPCPSLSCVILGILSPIGCGSDNPAAGQTPTHFIKQSLTFQSRRGARSTARTASRRRAGWRSCWTGAAGRSRGRSSRLANKILGFRIYCWTGCASYNQLNVFSDLQANVRVAKHWLSFVFQRVEFQFWSWKSSRQSLLNTFTACTSWWNILVVISFPFTSTLFWLLQFFLIV